jgi:hypothetical protein
MALAGLLYAANGADMLLPENASSAAMQLARQA